MSCILRRVSYIIYHDLCFTKQALARQKAHAEEGKHSSHAGLLIASFTA